MTTPENDAILDPLEDLLDVLDLKPVGSAHITLRDTDDEASKDFDLGESEQDIFIGRSQPMPHGRVFGGQVLAQSLIAAGRTIEDLADAADQPRRIHSLHGYFLRAGDPERPIRFAVERLRDGQSFSARRVHAIQNGRPILSMITSFQTTAAGLDHQDPMPDVPSPASLRSLAEELALLKEPSTSVWSEGKAIDVRHLEGGIYVVPGQDRVAQQSVWLKAIGQMTDDPLVHAAVLAYCSDYFLLEPVLRRHGLAWSDPRLVAASLDHAMWFHRPGRADEWTLYTQTSPSASGGRGLATGRMFSSDGTLLATVAQEGMLRLRQ